MKYKIGDTVRLKSAEELKKIGWCEERATVLGGREVFIEKIVLNKYYTHVGKYEIMLFEEDFDCVNSTVDKESYSFDELQRKIFEFKEYLEKVNNANDCCINVVFETAYGSGGRVGTELKIRT